MLKAVAWRAHEKGVELAYEVREGVPDILRGDLPAFRRVVTSLVGNAIKFTGDGDVTVHVHAGTVSDGAIELHVAVADTGVGMTPARQRLVVERLAGTAAAAPRHSSAASDLERAARLVKRLGGRLWLETAPAQGSVFHFTARFALAEAETGDAPAVADVPSRPELREVPILVVEDHPTTRRVLVETLSGWGMRPAAVEGAALAEAAIETARTSGRPFEIVLIDERPSGTGGATLAERLRSDGRFRGALIGLLPGDGLVARTACWTRIGAATCLTKPVTPSELWRAVMETRVPGARAGRVPQRLDGDASSRVRRGPASLR